MPDLIKFVMFMENSLDQYNNNLNFSISIKKNLNILLFIDICEVISRIVRAIKMESGNCLLIGTVGKGKNSLARMAVFLAENKLFEIG